MTFLLVSVCACKVIDAPSADLECSLPTDCTSPRTCEDGYCVIPVEVFDAEPFDPDANPDEPDAGALPDADPGAPDAAGCMQGPTIPFTDDFNDNSIDARWNDSATGTATATEVNGHVELTFQEAPPTHSAEFQTRDPSFDLSGLRVFVEVLQVVSNDGQTRFRLLLDGTHNVVIQQRDGVLIARYNDGDGNVTLNSFTYEPTQQRWWQFRESGSVLHFEVSPDGVIWNSLASLPSPSFISDIRVELQAAAPVPNVNPGSAHYDNLNVQPDCP